ncbi:transmembrane protein 185B [Tetranychus urticae]|uniref:Transmembrane protein 185A n=1 Tax=Tetranychus urticae TaxID=32264 RepID=T1KVW2_TETUR|nr:transmembrane protein 185B [Tetranychus urticae]
MNLQELLQEFNPSNFVVYTCLLLFSILFAFRLDGTITISYWLVFMPLWIWKCLVILGAVIGSLVWIKNPEYRLSESSYIHFKSMLISLSLQLLLLMFELLVCDKLESGRHMWILAFIPLIFISLLSTAICIWAFKNDRAFELEVFCAVNVLQFVFIALRLDRFINWSWVVVFVPFWIVMCLAIIAVLYALIFAAILLRTPEVAIEQRKASIHSAISYSLVVIPLLIFLVLLSNKLDTTSDYAFPPLRPTLLHAPIIDHIRPSYFTICIPLYFAFLILICLSFNSKGNNQWWFGMRKDFCSFLLSVCPCLREYGNISFNKQNNSLSSPHGSQSAIESDQVSAGNPATGSSEKSRFKMNHKKIMMPIMTLESPD